MKGTLIIVALFLCAIQALQGPSDYLQESDRAEFKKLLSSSKSYLGARNTFYTASIAKKLKQEVPDKTKVCENVKPTVQDISDIYYSVASQALLGCASASEKVTSEIKEAFKSDKLDKLYFGIKTALVLRANKQGVTDNEIKAAATKLIELGEDDGTFKQSLKAEDSSVLNGGLALDALGQIATELTLTNEEKDSYRKVLENAQDVFTSFGEEGENVLKLTDSISKASSLRVTSTVFKAFSTLAAALKEQLINPDEEKIVGITQYFIQNKRSTNVEDAYYVIEGLFAAAESKLGVPLVISLQHSSISASGKGENLLTVKVTNVVGDGVNSKLRLVKAYSVGSSDKPVITNQEIPGENGIHKFNFLMAKPEPGFYTLELSTSAGKPYINAEQVPRNVKVLTAVTIADLSVVVADSAEARDITDGRKYAVEYPKETVEEVIQVENNQYLVVNFKVKAQAGKSLQVQQAFVRIGNDKREFIAIAKSTGKQLQAVVKISDLADEFYGKSGQYQLSVIVADSFVQNPINWKFGAASITFTGKYEEPSSPFDARPEIQHVFRSAEKRAEAGTASIFTLAVLAPWAIFLIGLLRVGINFGNFPSGGLAPIYALAFQGTLGVILALYIVYWFQLTMVDTLKYLGVLMVPYLFFASKTLNHMTNANAQTQKQHRE